MNKVLCSLLLIALIGFVQCESFKRIHFENGVHRNLEVTAPKVAGLIGKHSNQTEVDVKLSEEWLKNNTLDTTVNTTMALFLHTPETGFAYTSDEFVKFSCSGECQTTSNSFNSYFGRFYISSCYQIKNDTATFVSLGDAWKLTNRAIHFSSLNSYGADRLNTNSTYGILGLGASGAARSNFQGVDAPIFSVSVNSTGKGSLIFGNDTKQIKANKLPYITWNTTQNWGAQPTSLSYKTKNITFSYNNRIQFDLHQVGANFTNDQFTDIVNALNLTYNATAPTNGFRYYYNATAKGPITKQPPLLLTIDAKNVSIPIEALFKLENPKTAPAIFTFMADSITWNYDYNTTGSPRLYPLVFGTHFLSNFYTVFHAPTAESAYVQLFPLYTPFTDNGSTSSSGGSGGKFLIGLIAVIGLGAVGFIVFRNKAASKLQEHLNEK